MNKTLMQQQFEDSLFSGGASYLEDLYESFIKDPQSVPPEWRERFTALPQVNGAAGDISHAEILDHFKHIARQPVVVSGGDAEMVRKQAQVMHLINAYRRFGHRNANLDPLGLADRSVVPGLTLNYHGLNDSDMDLTFNTGELVCPETTSLKHIVKLLQETYSGNIGVEYMHIAETEETAWIQERFEKVHSQPSYTPDEKRQILALLAAGEGLEKYLGTRYVGQKRFSLEGGESLIPAMHDMVQRSGDHGVKEIVIGMAHRGRLNVLVNVCGKSPEELFQEFEGGFQDAAISGDVKYHLGCSSDVQTNNGPVHVALAFNPSHLEAVDPVVEGSVRARQERRGDIAYKEVLPVLLHGDASFAGQGVVMETFNMSQARGYKTGGTIHIIVNNQIGFTTSKQDDARSTHYSSDVAKMVSAPVFHVNGDDPEAVVFAMQAALDYRMAFGKDVVLDLVCYRKHGHNEADEPSATQPLMYSIIKKHPSTFKLYSEQLISENIIDKAGVRKLTDDYREALDKGHPVVKLTVNNDEKYSVDWTPYLNQTWDQPCKTQVPLAELQKVGERLTLIPDEFVLQAQVRKEIEHRAAMIKGDQPMNWGAAETLAYATLVSEGYPVRLSGEDCGRGTFAHRHAVLHDNKTGDEFVSLENISDNQARFAVINSILSEYAVLGFEYGYATAAPKTLVIWEAQFGDFANTAQVVIDQFISSGEQKWGRLCGLSLFLPHGYEGMGPEHSSARLERYLQLCAEDNMQVCVPSTPAQDFHMIRRQAIRPLRIPLIVMTPKSLLRHKLAVSELSDLTEGSFHVVIPEVDELDTQQVKRVVLCSGKVYYDLLEERRKQGIQNCALIRIEQLYPFPGDVVKSVLAEYSNATDIIWCQEEPKNQGAWYFMRPRLETRLPAGSTLSYVGRALSASPATGLASKHIAQQKKLVAEALGLEA